MDRRESPISELTFASALNENLLKSEKVKRDIWTHIHHRSNTNQLACLQVEKVSLNSCPALSLQELWPLWWIPGI